MKRVTGLGGVFFKAKNPQAMRDWYSKYLGVPYMSSYGGTFVWRQKENPDTYGHTAWSVMDDKTEYYNPSKSDFMINYRVEDLDALLKTLEEEGIPSVGESESYDYGKFGWIMDPDGNKIELWEPIESAYHEMLGVNEVPRGVVGIGGVFFKSPDPHKSRQWYAEHLGIPVSEHGGFFEWRVDNPERTLTRTAWGPMPSDTDYFDPSESQLMINYQVEDLDSFLKSLTEAKIKVVGEVQEYPYGKFGWVLDPEDNKIELWEPNNEYAEPG